MMRTIRYYCKAFRKIAAFEPMLIPLTLVLAVATGAKPFVNIIFPPVWSRSFPARVRFRR